MPRDEFGLAADSDSNLAGLGSVFGYCQRGASPLRGVVHSLSWRPFMFVREIRIAQKRSQKDFQAGGSGKCSSDVFIN